MTDPIGYETIQFTHLKYGTWVCVCGVGGGSFYGCHRALNTSGSEDK